MTYPAASDVRFGVDRGDGVLGTLRVPAPSLVLKDVSVDATVGSLDVMSSVTSLLATLNSDSAPSVYAKDPYWDMVTIHVGVDDDLNVVVDKFSAAPRLNRGSVATLDSAISGTTFCSYRGKPTIKFNGGYIRCLPSEGAPAITGSGDWTVEMMFSLNTTSVASGISMLFCVPNYFDVGVTLTGSIGVWMVYESPQFLETLAGTVQPNTKYYFVAQRAGNMLSIYLDGNRIMYRTLTSASTLSNLTAGQEFNIGYDNSVAGREFFGYMQDITVTSGIARYSGATMQVPDRLYPRNGALSATATTTINGRLAYIADTAAKLPLTATTVSTPVVGDSLFSKVVMLLHMEDFSDVKGHVATTVGTPVCGSAAYKFGTKSMYVGGAGNYVQYAGSDLALIAGDFCVEAWIRITSGGVNQGVWLLGDMTSNDHRIQGAIGTSNQLVFLIQTVSSATLTLTSSNTLNLNQWYHVAWVREGAVGKIYCDGALVGSSSITAYPDARTTLTVGTARSGGVSVPLNGYIDEFRVTSNAARYSTAFTPPTEAFYDHGTTLTTTSYTMNAALSADPTLQAINAKTSQLTFTATGVVADTGIASGTALPAASDVRKGVVVGSSVGTLQVPPATFVMRDVPVDNTLGSLDVFGTLDNLVAVLQNGGVKARTIDPQWSSVTLSIQVDDNLNVVPIKTIVGFELLQVTYDASVSVYSKIYGTKAVTYRGKPTIRLNGGYLHTTNPSSVQPMSGSGNWTVEMCFRADALPAVGNVLMLFQYQSYMNVEIGQTGDIGVWFSSYSDNSYHATTGLNIQPNRFYMLAMQRSGNYLSLYVDGLRVIYFQLTNALTSLFGWGTTMNIGHDLGVGSRVFIGYMQDITVTDGVARYSGTSYTPAAAPYPYNGALAPLSTSTISEQLYSLFATTSAIDSKTSQLTFTSNGVVADAGATGGGGGTSTDYTARFNTLDTSVAAVNTAVAAVKAKTDQLAFTGGTVNANAASTNYASRFDSIDNALLNLSLTDYTATLGRIETKVDNIAVPTSNLTTIQNALTSISAAVGTVYSKVSPLTYTETGVVADVTVSVQQVIDYAARFDAIDSDLDSIKLKVNPLTYGTNGVMATANVDIQPLSTTLSSGLSSLLTSVNPRFNAIDTKLIEIGNATGAIDLTPITDALDDIYASVQSVPRLDYTATFVGVVNKLNLIQGKTDTIPALAAAVSNIPTVTYSTTLANLTSAVAAIPTTNYSNTLSSLVSKVDAIPTTEYTTTLAGIADTANLTYAKVNSMTGCDLNPVLTALAALDARFNQTSSGALAVIPQASADKTTIYGYCRTAAGDPIPNATVSIRIQQASGVGSLYAAAGLAATSDAEGRVVFTIPRDPTIVVVVSLGSKVERFKCNGESTQAMPSIVGDIQPSGGGNAF